MMENIYSLKTKKTNLFSALVKLVFTWNNSREKSLCNTSISIHVHVQLLIYSILFYEDNVDWFLKQTNTK